MRQIAALAAGSLFGIGLYVSGMTDTRKVQGWLDIFGDWDPTLAFVMAGAIVPMAVAWRIARRRAAPLLGGRFPNTSRSDPDRPLIVGALLFGAGWGLSGLCPGPALASATWGGWNGLLFLAAMATGMVAAPPVRDRLAAMAAA